MNEYSNTDGCWPEPENAVETATAPTAASAPPPPEPQGHCERSRLATCSLPVSLVEDVATLMNDCAPQVTQWQAQWLVSLAAELRAHAACATKRQPAEND